MIVDLGEMNYRQALEIIQWCFHHGVDREKTVKIMDAMNDIEQRAMINEEWTLDIPERYVTYLMLKWS